MALPTINAVAEALADAVALPVLFAALLPFTILSAQMNVEAAENDVASALLPPAPEPVREFVPPEQLAARAASGAPITNAEAIAMTLTVENRFVLAYGIPPKAAHIAAISR